MEVKEMSWKDFKGYVDALCNEKRTDKYFFRGQNISNKGLTSSFHRQNYNGDGSISMYFDEIIADVHYYLSYIHNEIKDITCCDEMGALLSLLRHQGFPTPFIDWSLSPYVAAYFVFNSSNEANTKYVDIFMFNSSKWMQNQQKKQNLKLMKAMNRNRDEIREHEHCPQNKLLLEARGYLLDEVEENDRKIRRQILQVDDDVLRIVRTHPKYNPRIIPQRGAFTISNIQKVDVYLTKIGNEDNTKYLECFKILASEKWRVLRELNSKAINGMTLFPDIQGICMELEKRHFSDKYP